MPLTREEHFELGAKLSDARSTILKGIVQVSHHYPLTHPALVALRKAENELSSAKSKLDDQICREHPTDVTVTRAYYSAKR